MTFAPAALPRRQDLPETPPRTLTGRRAAVVVNPSKFADGAALGRFRAEVEEALAAIGWFSPMWMPTTEATRGFDEGRSAAAEGANVVLVAGGDGTIRAVAQALAGSGIPLGLLPAGTGNLLARNLGVPRGDVAASVRLACEGEERMVDLGWLELDRTGNGEHIERFAFLVMAGAGFDAAIMAGADEALKSRLGTAAYLVSGARAIREPMSRGTLSVDGVRQACRPSHGFVVGNCGTLTMGLELMPDADPGDGVLDGVELLPKSLLEWARVAWSVVRRGRAHRLLPRFAGRSVEFRSEIPRPVEVDGDVVGDARLVRVRVERGALLVRCPAW